MQVSSHTSMDEFYKYQLALLFLTWVHSNRADSIFAHTAWSKVIMWSCRNHMTNSRAFIDWRIGFHETGFSEKKYVPSGETSFPNVQKHETPPHTLRNMHRNTVFQNMFRNKIPSLCSQRAGLQRKLQGIFYVKDQIHALKKQSWTVSCSNLGMGSVLYGRLRL